MQKKNPRLYITRNNKKLKKIGIYIAVYTKKLTCHPELAAKSVETVSKRDFMPLPGVSGSYHRQNSETSLE